MPFCPQCRYEYTPSTTECPDCGVALVDRLPETETSVPESGGRFVPLPELPGQMDAVLVKGALEAEGILCYMQMEGLIQTVGVSGTGPVNHGARIFVSEDRYEDALRIQEGMFED